VTPIESFAAYFRAFEATYRDDEWSRLERLFTPDAVYHVVGSELFDCSLRGRDAILAGLRKFVDGFDRKCERRLEAIEAPVAGASGVRFRGTAWYRRGASPEFGIELEEQIEFVDGQIVRMIDIYAPGLAARAAGWMERWGADLELSYG
jgi:hypothetical protein